MKRHNLWHLLVLGLVFILSGCVVRTYSLTRDRIDQDLSGGNRGYLKGEAPTAEERKPTRTTRVVEIELRSPLKFEGKSKQKFPEKAEEPEDLGNRGYITQGAVSEIVEPKASAVTAGYEKYTVQKSDTLQKISRKFYGTTKKWNKIYEANQDVLKGPDKIYPGQVINIPLESLLETQENLK
jgi:nucleoid-associated protein YgaU